MRSMPWLDADLAQSETRDSGESPSCFFTLFMVNFLFLHEALNWGNQRGVRYNFWGKGQHLTHFKIDKA